MKMANAIKAVRSEEMGLKKSSKVYEGLKSTFKNKVNSKKTDIEKLTNTRLCRKPVLPYNLEEELASYCLMMERKFFGLTTESIKRKVFELAIKTVLSVHFQYNREEQTGSGCVNLCAAMRLRLRKPQATSAARAKGLAKDNVVNFFDVFEPLLRLINSSPHRLHNCVETGLTVAQRNACKVILLRVSDGSLLCLQERGIHS